MEQFERVLPYKVGIEAKGILSFLEQLEKGGMEMHSFMLMRHDKVVAEGSWKPYAKDKKHMLFSLSKSFTSIAVGFAVQEGLFSIEDRVISFFTDKLPCTPCEYMQKMKVKHLLMMATGHSSEPDIMHGEEGADWVYGFLTSYVDKEPGSVFTYNTAATYMLSAIVQKVSGEKMVDYLKSRLFDPLDITDYWWEECPEGITTGGFGLNLMIEDLAKFGSFCLHRGQWKGKQLLNQSWFDEATANMMDNNPQKSTAPSDWIQGYGYQFWQCQPDGVYRGDGAFGQYCIVMPVQDALLVANSTQQDMQRLLTAAWEILLPAMKEEVLQDVQMERELKERLKKPELKTIKGLRSSEIKAAVKISGKEYRLSENRLQLESIGFVFGEPDKLRLGIEGKISEISLGQGEWTESRLDLAPGYSSLTETAFFSEVSCCGAWLNEKSYQAVLVYDRTPFSDTIKVEFDEQGVIVFFKRNIGFTSVDLRIYGRQK